MTDQADIKNYLMELIGEEGCCGAACTDADVFMDNEGWKLMLEGFMEPWNIGKTVHEAKATLREYASMGFGLS